MKAKRFLDTVHREEEQRWREERRAREERRSTVERGWRENPSTTQGLRVTDVRKAEWLLAMRWRRRIQAACAGSELTFTQWLVLDSARQLSEEAKDAVIQTEIAARIELDHATISEVTQRLEAKGLVSRGEDITGLARRVLLTERARRLLHELDTRVEDVSSTTG